MAPHRLSRAARLLGAAWLVVLCPQLVAAQTTVTSRTSALAGTVVNERREPVSRATVFAFPVARVKEALATAHAGRFPLLVAERGSTDPQGRFRIAGLAAGEYIVAAEATSVLPRPGSIPAALYATTFYPSTTAFENAVAVHVDGVVSVEIALVPVRGARIAGVVTHVSGTPAEGLPVALLRSFGGIGVGGEVATVGRDGRFEVSGLRPGTYRLTIGPPSSEEFMETIVDMQDVDIDSLEFKLGAGASVTGRVVVDAGETMTSAAGLVVRATPSPDALGRRTDRSSPVSTEWTFALRDLSGAYQFFVSADRMPFAEVRRMVVNGVEWPPAALVPVTSGAIDVTLVIGPRSVPKPTIDPTLTTAELVERFKTERFDFRQFEVAEVIVERGDRSVLPEFEPLLTHDFRRRRGNAAFVFAKLGDPRGFQIIADILTDFSDRPLPPDTRPKLSVRAQIASDRYYAAHLMGDLRDPRGIALLVPLLHDADVSAIVPWSLQQIGGPDAIQPLIDALDAPDASTRVLIIYALEALNAKAAVPRLNQLLGDTRRSRFGNGVTVADAARGALSKLR